MKKRVRRLLRLENAMVFLLSLILCFVTSCKDEKDVSVKKYGIVTFGVQTDATFTRSSDESIPKGYLDPAEYIIQIWNSEGELVEEFLLDEKDELEMESGTYTISATWGEDVVAQLGEDFIYMEGSESFDIVEEETSRVQIKAIPGNAKVVVSYSKELDDVYSDYYIQMNTSHNQDDPLLYSKEETRPAFFRANAQNEQLALNMIFKVDQTEYPFDQFIDIAPRDSVSIILNLAPDEGGGQNPGPDPQPQRPYINTEISGYTFVAEDPEPLTVKVTTNCSTYQITSNDTWFKAEKNSAGNLVIIAENNDTEQERSGSVTLVATNTAGGATAKIELTQNAANSGGGEPEPGAPAIQVNKTYHQFAGKNPEPETIQVTTNCDNYDIITTDGWFTTQKTAGGVLVTPEANDSKIARFGSIILSANNDEGTAIVVVGLLQLGEDGQGGGNPGTDPEQPFIAALSGGIVAESLDEYFIGVKSNVDDWYFQVLEENTNWLKVEKQADGFKLTTVGLNTTGEDRTATIVLYASLNGETDHDQIIVTQTNKVEIPAPTIEAPATFTFSKEGGTETVGIITNVTDWQATVSGSGEWLQVEPVGKQLKLTADPFNEEGKRSATVTLIAYSEDGRFSYASIEVTQEGLSAPKLQLTIKIDDTTVKDTTLIYQVENPLTDEPKIALNGFKDGESFIIQQGSARSFFATLYVPNEIVACTLTGDLGENYNLLSSENTSGTFCSVSDSGTFGLIYLDAFLNQLLEGEHNYTLKVVDDRGLSDEVTIKVNVINQEV